MTTKQAKSSFEIKSWDEKTWDGKNWKEVAGKKLTKAVFTQALQGDIEGLNTVHNLTSYDSDEMAIYVGMEQFVGKVDGKSGSFVLQGSGKFENSVASSTSTIIEGSGTGELKGIRGTWKSVSGENGTPFTITLDYDFA